MLYKKKNNRTTFINQKQDVMEESECGWDNDDDKILILFVDDDSNL